MKLRYLALILVSLPLMFARPAVASGEAITSFAQSLNLDSSNTLAVTTTIDYEFADAKPHDIPYTIPLTYHDAQGQNFPITFQFGSLELNGAQVPVTPDVTPARAIITLPASNSPSSQRRYVVRYQLAPIVMKGDRDVFRLNTTGSSWLVPINRSVVRLDAHTAPADNIVCFTGTGTQNTSNCVVDQKGELVTITSDTPLPPGQSLTFTGDFPPKSFSRYLTPTTTGYGWLWILLPLGLVAVVGAVVWLAVRLAKRPRRRPARASKPTPATPPKGKDDAGVEAKEQPKEEPSAK